MVHFIVRRLIEAFLIKISLFAFTAFERRHVSSKNIKNMLRDHWTTGSLVPFSHGSKVPCDIILHHES